MDCLLCVCRCSRLRIVKGKLNRSDLCLYGAHDVVAVQKIKFSTLSIMAND